jgi:hypothetical protein
MIAAKGMRIQSDGAAPSLYIIIVQETMSEEMTAMADEDQVGRKKSIRSQSTMQLLRNFDNKWSSNERVGI